MLATTRLRRVPTTLFWSSITPLLSSTEPVPAGRQPTSRDRPNDTVDLDGEGLPNQHASDRAERVKSGAMARSRMPMAEVVEML